MEGYVKAFSTLHGRKLRHSAPTETGFEVRVRPELGLSPVLTSVAISETDSEPKGAKPSPPLRRRCYGTFLTCRQIDR